MLAEDKFTIIPSVSVRQTPKGLGVFSEVALAQSCIVGEIFGEFISDPDYGSDHCIDLEDGRFFEPVAPFRYVNHCCQPNCELDWFEHIDERYSMKRLHVYLTAIDDVQPGCELTIDYNWPLDSAIPCLCNDPECRGVIAGWDEMNEILE